MTFYLGTLEPSWLGRTDLPLFLARGRLARVKGRLPAAAGRWALDSGAFSEIAAAGAFRTPAAQYADEAARYRDEVGGLDFAAVQDWMCEPVALSRTGKTVREHQDLTTRSFLDLSALAPAVPWCPVLQGWSPDDYLRHAEAYASAGVDLASLPRVGVGSVCRRQGTAESLNIFRALSGLGLRLHGFGLKVRYFTRDGHTPLASADSMAWSKRARHSGPLPGCPHRRCANCFRFAERWRCKVLRVLARPRQLSLF